MQDDGVCLYRIVPPSSRVEVKLPGKDELRSWGVYGRSFSWKATKCRSGSAYKWAIGLHHLEKDGTIYGDY